MVEGEVGVDGVENQPNNEEQACERSKKRVGQGARFDQAKEVDATNALTQTKDG